MQAILKKQSYYYWDQHILRTLDTAWHNEEKEDLDLNIHYGFEYVEASSHVQLKSNHLCDRTMSRS